MAISSSDTPSSSRAPTHAAPEPPPAAAKPAAKSKSRKPTPVTLAERLQKVGNTTEAQQAEYVAADQDPATDNRLGDQRPSKESFQVRTRGGRPYPTGDEDDG